MMVGGSAGRPRIASGTERGDGAGERGRVTRRSRGEERYGRRIVGNGKSEGRK